MIRFAVCLTLCFLGWLTQVGAEERATPKRFSFAALGDVPYGPRDAHWTREVLREIDQEELQFVLHVGDLKSSSEPCSDALILQRKALLTTTRHALVYLPGDNEWTDCELKSNPPFAPQERLERLREWFYPDEMTLGGAPFRLQRQSEIAKFRQYRENVRWEMHGVLFVGLNIPGSNNNYRKEAGRNGEFEERLLANEYWLQRAFAQAQQRQLPAIVIAFQANPFFERHENPKALYRDGYQELRRLLWQLASQYQGHVLLIHGDTHRYRFNQPLNWGSGNKEKSLPHVSRLEVFGSPSALNWVKVNVDLNRSNPFSVEVKQISVNSPD
ncbi:hypothetical protein [Parvibium lacunae]|uniref:Calcineurin-like phosphoesterase domain-containing protein n=1 Tax=Parvibium lacunae TaxID=1888893 RepID=A0A368L789_9BURK|nr:hypothetical protein [Parvibium lacunae]RCS59530.1 hypothetical protein DU000_02040 [Parvibium lacunae]